MRARAIHLPVPNRERWQPLRSGLVNLYKYDNEEFHYENGRLLLRGNNGTGKSRVLALQLPFLLDGETNPERLEPDADPSRRIEWNLLMDRYPDRTGYTWIEFGRRDNAGQESFCTIGCGLSATEGRAGAQRWFFITSQRIGAELELVSDLKQALGIDRLRRKIGAAGRVFESAAEYRRAVNHALFQMDEDRYASLLNLLIQLRRPQLTRRLEEHKLSKALSEALPPVASALAMEIAELFRELQADRSQLHSSKAARSGVEEFLGGYRSYAAIAAKRSADQVLAVHDDYESSTNEILAAEAECDRYLSELARLKTELQMFSDEEHALQARIGAFQQNAQTANAQALEQLQHNAAEMRMAATRAASDLSDMTLLKEDCNREYVRLRSVLEQREAQLAAASENAGQAAAGAGMPDIHAACFEAQELRNADVRTLQTVRSQIDNVIRGRLENIAQVAAFNEQVARTKAEFERVAAESDHLSGLLDDARERLHTTRSDYQAAVAAFLDGMANWTADLAELPLPFDDGFLRSLSDWCDRPLGPNPFAAAIRKSVDQLNVHYAETRAYLKQQERLLTEELQQLEGAVDNPELQNATAECRSRLDAVTDSLLDLDRREARLRSEAWAVPGDEAVRRAYEYSLAISQHADSLQQRLDNAASAVAHKQAAYQEVLQARSRALREMSLDSRADDLEELREGLAQYGFALTLMWRELESLRESNEACAWAGLNLEQIGTTESRQKEVTASLERFARAAEIVRDSAEHAAGHNLEEVVAEIAQLRHRLEELGAAKLKASRRYHDTEMAVTRVDERLRSRTVALTGDSGRRDTAASALRQFASTGLLSLVTSDIDGSDATHWSTARVVEVAFELSRRLARIEAGNAAWDACQKSIPMQYTALMQTLSAQGIDAAAAFHDDVFVATAIVAGQQRGMEELRQILLNDVTDRQLLLASRSREILENHIVGEVSNHLCQLLHAAEAQVQQMNVELENHPMSTGMKLRFVWQPAEENPTGIAEARRRLMQLDDNWSPDERRMLGLFVQEQIEMVYANLGGASWEQALAEALDYRRWHRFGVERYQDGVWKRLTERTYGTGSGGEKAVALTLPQFAAAAAFYRTAAPTAPRLILLDEAFVGIDADMRAKCMGLIDSYDLDFMMTSEREWGCYQTLSGLAIYQLSTRPDIDAIGLTRWVWNGHQHQLIRTTNEAYEISEPRDLVAVESPQRR